MSSEPLSPQLMQKLVFTVMMHGLNDSQTLIAYRVLTDALAHDNPLIRELAVVAMSDLAVSPGKRVQSLALALKDPLAKIRRRAARALGDQGSAAQAVLPELIQGLKDHDASVRRDAAGAVGRVGPPAYPASAALIPLLVEPDSRTRAVALVALKRIGRGAIPALLEGLQSTSPMIRGECIKMLGKIAAGDALIRGAIESLADDPDPDVRMMVKESLQLWANIPADPPSVIRNELPAIV